MIRWFARNDIASNFLIIGILLWGGWSVMERVPLEVQPAIEFNMVEISANYRGGSPEDVERAVVIPIESAMEGLHGVDRIESQCGMGGARVRVVMKEGSDPKDHLEEIKTRVSHITNFPQEMEPVRCQIPDSAMWFDVIKIAIAGELEEDELLKAARRVRDDLVEMPGISQATVLGMSPQEIAIEADPMRLRDFGLTFADLSAAIQR